MPQLEAMTHITPTNSNVLVMASQQPKTLAVNCEVNYISETDTSTIQSTYIPSPIISTNIIQPKTMQIIDQHYTDIACNGQEAQQQRQDKVQHHTSVIFETQTQGQHDQKYQTTHKWIFIEETPENTGDCK